MVVESISTLIGIIGLILEHRSEHTSKPHEKKKRLGLVLLVISIAGLLLTSISNYLESEELSNDIKALRFSNDTLKTQLDSSTQKLSFVVDKLKDIRAKNDSLLLVNQILREMIKTTKQDISILSAQTNRGFAQNLKSIETIGKASGTRIISRIDKDKMISILSTRKGKAFFKLCVGDREILQYAEQLKAVFKSSGWQIPDKYEYIYVNPPLEGLRVVIKKNDHFPVGLEETVKAFRAVDINHQIFYAAPNENALADYVYILVGYK